MGSPDADDTHLRRLAGVYDPKPEPIGGKRSVQTRILKVGFSDSGEFLGD